MDITFTLQSTTDGSLMTGQASNVTVYLGIDGAAFSASTNTAAEIGRGCYKLTLTSAEAAFSTLLYAPVCTGAQSNIYQLDAAPAIPTAADNATAVWAAQTKEVTIATAQADTFATASSVANIATVAGAIKAKTDNLPATPAAVGSEMALTSAAISAVQNGLATSSELTALETHGDSYWHTASTAGLATGQGLENLATYGDAHWATATGFATPSDLSGLSTFNSATDTVTINSTQAAGMVTATGFATPSDIPSASDNATAVWSANSRTLTESALTAADVWSYSSRTLTASALTAQDVWEYSTRELTASPTDLTGIATSQDISDLQTHGDSNWNTATGFATPTNVSDAKADIISAIPTDYAKPGNAMTLTSSTLASVLTGVWNYENRSLTQEIVSQVTAEDIASISIAVWSYVPRKLTSIVSDVIEPNKP